MPALFLARHPWARISWRHAICPACWNQDHPDRPCDSLLGVLSGEPDLCCFCGWKTWARIFIRHNPRELLCRGRHP